MNRHMWLVATASDSPALDFPGGSLSTINPIASTVMTVTVSFRVEAPECGN